MLDFELVSALSDFETISVGHGIRDLPRLSSNARNISMRPRKSAQSLRRFAVCVRNEGYEASLERNKIYVVLPDDDVEQAGDLRIIDESGEDYIFSADRFVAIDVPPAVKASLSLTSKR
jgi:hypothetical protein